jgi:predicted nucleotidyltransferase
MTRARWALSQGVDVVLQLPAVFSLSSAERFAWGSVSILEGTGVLDCLSFGSEVTDPEILRRAAAVTGSESQKAKEALKTQLALGRSYPRARHTAYAAAGISEDVLRALALPNSTLGIEYLRSLERLRSKAEPVIIPRFHAMHDSNELAGKFASASAIRGALCEKNAGSLERFIPEEVFRDICSFEKNGASPVTQGSFSNIILYAVRSLSKQELKALPDVSEGFENVLYDAARSCASYEKFLFFAKSKRYTLARIRRISMYALLRITRELQIEAADPAALYLRVLGIRSGAKRLLGEIGRNSKYPLIIRASDPGNLSSSAERVFQNDIFCDEVYALGTGLPAASDFTKPLLIL